MASNTTQNNIEVFRGDDWSMKLTFADENGTALNITGWTIFFTLKKKKTDTDADAVLQKNVTPESPTTGVCTVVLTNTETLNLLGLYYYDFQYKDDDGVVQTITSGGLTFVTDITRRIS